ncbi:unnamed protein product [Ambrosiozyma monospora]|uniref:Unnamed protein product n=1 Tax=Ambrosiozyma monospora TaxID=43982 RepID=A0A9W6YTJ5_AMBMO|nr:unnamed protein product [Ambrosiozyma monospora]
MSASNVTATWFDALPIARYAQLVETNLPGPKDKVVRPPNPTIGTPKIEVSCGPNIRYLGCLEDGKPNYRASILIVTKGDVPQTPTMSYIIGPANKDDSEADLTLNYN